VADITISTGALFGVHVDHLDGWVSIRLIGELDLDGVDCLREEIWPLLGRYEAHLVTFDCADLTFLDSTGAGMLVRLARAIAGPGKPTLQSLSPAPHRVLQLMGVDTLFEVTGRDRFSEPV